jgi:tetratricopeptide (TPR) repeat protein
MAAAAPASGADLVRAGNERLKAGRPDEALARFVEALDEAPGHVPAMVGFVRAALALGRSAEAEEAAAQALALAPEDRDANLFGGVASEARGRLPEAIARYEKALAKDAKSWLAHFNLGRALAQVGRRDEAAEKLARACELAPREMHEPWHALALVEESRARTGDAIRAETRAIEANPAFIEGYLSLADLLSAAGKEETADKVLEQAESLFPKAGTVLDKRAALAVKRGDLQGALTLLERQVALEPQNRSAYLHLSTYAQVAGDLPRAEHAIRRLLERDPKSAEAHYHLGSILEAANLVEKAKASFREAIRLSPSAWRPRNNLAHILQSEGTKEARAEAAALLEEAIRLAPQDEPAPRYNAALVALAEGDAARARRLAEEVVKRAPAGHALAQAAQDVIAAAKGA